MLCVYFSAVRNDRKKKPVDGNAADTSTNNNSSGGGNVKTEPVTYLTDKDQKLIDIILDAHRQTLPGGPILNTKVCCPVTM